MTVDILRNRIDVSTPVGQSGDWSIEEFHVSDEEAAMYNLRHTFRGTPWMCVNPGSYRKLTHSKRGVVMSNTPMEVHTNAKFLLRAKGSVLVNGLGLGMVLTALFAKDNVTKVTVVEIDKDVIALTAGHFAKEINEGRLVIINEDCMTRKVGEKEQYECVWHDIWDTISDENIEQMNKLKRKFAKHTKWQACWAEDQCRDMKAKFVAQLKAHGKTMADFNNYMKGKTQ